MLGSLLISQGNDLLRDEELDGLLLPVLHVAVQLVRVHACERGRRVTWRTHIGREPGTNTARFPAHDRGKLPVPRQSKNLYDTAHLTRKLTRSDSETSLQTHALKHASSANSYLLATPDVHSSAPCRVLGPFSGIFGNLPSWCVFFPPVPVRGIRGSHGADRTVAGRNARCSGCSEDPSIQRGSRDWTGETCSPPSLHSDRPPCMWMAGHPETRARAQQSVHTAEAWRLRHMPPSPRA